MITKYSQLDPTKTYTYADYLTWRFKERVELLWGKLFKMTAAPSREHQRVLGELHIKIKQFLKNNGCQVYLAPFDVRLPLKGKKDEDVHSVVQPDLCVVCNPEILDDAGCLGVPDLMVEILSPHSSRRDLNEKYKLYETVGVREYWVVEPVDGLVQLFVLDKHGKFEIIKPYTVVETVQSVIFPDLEIELNEIFPNLLNEPEEIYEGKRI